MIVGRVDDMVNGKVFGWAFDSDHPDEHLEIRVNRGSQTVATGIANTFRKDLPDAGVGNGDHAFHILLPPDISSFFGLTLVARSSKSGELLLPIATNDDRRVDDLFAVVAERYDNILIEFKSEIDKIRSETALSQPAEARLSDFDGRLSKLEKRLEDFEVFALRQDEISRKMQERLGLMKPRGIFSWLRRK